MKSPLPFLLLLILFASCSTVKKLITHTHAITDSVSGSTHDTTNVKKFVNVQKDIDISDISIDIVYPTTASDSSTIKFDTGPIGDIERVINKTRPSKITVHVGKISDSSRITVSKDSTSIHDKDTVSVKKDIITNIRDVSKKHSPAWITFAIIAVILGLLVYVFIHFNLSSLIKKLL